MRFLIFLAASAALARGQEEPSPFRAEEVAWYLNGGKAIQLVGCGFDEPVSIRLLRKGLNYPPRVLSLVADTSDRDGPVMALYLVNKSDQPVTGIRFRGLPTVEQEVRVGEAWRSTERRVLMCGNDVSDDETRTLAPEQAMVFLGQNAETGDAMGEMRYRIHLDDGREVTSRTMVGKYSTKNLEAADRESVARHSPQLPFPKGGKEPFDWAEGLTPPERESLVAQLEFERIHGGFTYLREVAHRWLAYLDANPGDAECQQALRALLEREWTPEADEMRHFNHCLAMLSEDKADKAAGYGNPARFHALAWTYLGELMRVGESRGSLQAAKADPPARQNPWGISQEQVVALVKLAEERVKWKESDREDAAAGFFLTGTWITADHLPDEQVRALLEEDSPVCRKAALEILSRRGLSEEAGTWLLKRCDALGDEALELSCVIAGGSPMPAWQTELTLKLLERKPAEIFQRLGWSAESALEYPDRPRLPDVFREPARKFLESEIANPQGGDIEYSTTGQDPATNAAENAKAGKRRLALYDVLRLWAHWKKPEDLDLLKKFLTHPTGHRETGLHDEPVKYYDVREFVVELLKKRGDPVPADVQLMEKL